MGFDSIALTASPGRYHAPFFRCGRAWGIHEEFEEQVTQTHRQRLKAGSLALPFYSEDPYIVPLVSHALLNDSAIMALIQKPYFLSLGGCTFEPSRL